MIIPIIFLQKKSLKAATYTDHPIVTKGIIDISCVSGYYNRVKKKFLRKVTIIPAYFYLLGSELFITFEKK